MEQKTPVSPIDRTPPAKDDDGNFSLGILEQPGTHFAASRGAADAVLPQDINASRQRDRFAVGAKFWPPGGPGKCGRCPRTSFHYHGSMGAALACGVPFCGTMHYLRNVLRAKKRAELTKGAE
jgi:hypothetical protein